MRVFRGVPRQADTSSALTIGNFDGIHKGHEALLAHLVEQAHARSLPATVLTFEPHPREFFSPQSAPARLASLREKLLLLAANRVERVHVCQFNHAFAALSAQTFVDELLIKGLAPRHLIIGDDFCFGAGRQGNFSLLQQSGALHGFTVSAMPTFELDGTRVSSSAVRDALASGNLTRASLLLGRPYSIAGKVISGQRLGRTLGFPTANIQLKHRKPALTGVYAVGVEGLGHQTLAGVANIGVRPTVADGLRPNLEVHLMHWEADCYGAHLRVHFIKKLRDEIRFDSLHALTRQITDDVRSARTWFEQNPNTLEAARTDHG